MKNENLNRRTFLGKSVATVGAASLMAAGDIRSTEAMAPKDNRPEDVTARPAQRPRPICPMARSAS